MWVVDVVISTLYWLFLYFTSILKLHFLPNLHAFLFKEKIDHPDCLNYLIYDGSQWISCICFCNFHSLSLSFIFLQIWLFSYLFSLFPILTFSLLVRCHWVKYCFTFFELLIALLLGQILALDQPLNTLLSENSFLVILQTFTHPKSWTISNKTYSFEFIFNIFIFLCLFWNFWQSPLFRKEKWWFFFL